MSGAVKEMALTPKGEHGLAKTTTPQIDLSAMFERLAANPDVPLDKLQTLMDMQRGLVADRARVLFNEAMAAAQKAMRPVAADATNPQTRSKYATYAALDTALRPIYTEHGFALSFDTDLSPLAEHTRVLCLVTHDAGHERTYKVDMPSDGKGAKGGDVMTKTHASGAAMSYGMRYLLKMIFNVAVGEDDRDGNQVAKAPPAPAGYDDWITDLLAVADEGVEAVETAWQKSRKEFRQYLNAHSLDDWKRIKTKAKAADAKAAGK